MRVMTFVIFLFSVWMIFSCQKNSSMTFSEFQKQVNLLEQEQRYEAAYQLVENVWDVLPDREFELIKELAYLNNKTEQYEKNLVLWKKGHDKGYFFLLHKRMPQYKPYLAFTEFNSLVKVDSTLRQAAIAKSKTRFEVITPDKYRTDKTYPLLMILHGGGSDMEKMKNRWQLLPLLKSELIVVYVQSYRHYDAKSFGWRSGDERALREIREGYEDILQQYNIDTTRVLLGGTSAGGTMVLDIAFRNTLSVKGIIGFCPGKPRDFDVSQISNKAIKIYMLGGETDFYLDRQKDMAGLFAQANIDYIHDIMPGMGHAFPEDYPRVMEKALGFILNDD